LRLLESCEIGGEPEFTITDSPLSDNGATIMRQNEEREKEREGRESLLTYRSESFLAISLSPSYGT
jgi:hypothetical protein